MKVPAGGFACARVGEFQVDLRVVKCATTVTKSTCKNDPSRFSHPPRASAATCNPRRTAEKLWPADTFVDFEHSINTAMMKLREALEDDAENPRFIETLTRHGYRFIAPVEIVGAQGGASAVAPVNDRRKKTAGQSAATASGAGRSWRPERCCWSSAQRSGIAISANHPPRPDALVVPFTSFPGHEVDASLFPRRQSDRFFVGRREGGQLGYLRQTDRRGEAAAAHDRPGRKTGRQLGLPMVATSLFAVTPRRGRDLCRPRPGRPGAQAPFD